MTALTNIEKEDKILRQIISNFGAIPTFDGYTSGYQIKESSDFCLLFIDLALKEKLRIPQQIRNRNLDRVPISIIIINGYLKWNL